MSDRRKELAAKTISRLERFSAEIKGRKHDWIIDASHLREVIDLADEALRLAVTIPEMNVAEGYKTVARGFLQIVTTRRDWSTWRTYWIEQAVQDLGKIVAASRAEER